MTLVIRDDADEESLIVSPTLHQLTLSIDRVTHNYYNQLFQLKQLAAS